MILINCEITLDLNQSEKFVIANTKVANQGITFLRNDTKLYVPLVTLLTQDNTKLIEQLKYGFKRLANYNKYQPKVSSERPNEYLYSRSKQTFYHLKMKHKESDKQCCLLTKKIKNHNVMIDGQNFFDQQVRNDLITYSNRLK